MKRLLQWHVAHGYACSSCAELNWQHMLGLLVEAGFAGQGSGRVGFRLVVCAVSEPGRHLLLVMSCCHFCNATQSQCMIVMQQLVLLAICLRSTPHWVLATTCWIWLAGSALWASIASHCLGLFIPH
jgi:hypothetical protein